MKKPLKSISMLLFLAGIPAGMTAVSLPMETTWKLCNRMERVEGL